MNVIDEGLMKTALYTSFRILRPYVWAILGAGVTMSMAQAGTVTIAVTPSSLAPVDAVARAFEAAHVGDHARIVIAPGTELKAVLKNLPVQMVVSDDLSLIEWMESRDFASRPMGRPAISVPLAVVASSSDTVAFSSSGELINRMKQQDAVLTIFDPLRTDCGRRAQALLNALGISAEPSAHLALAPHAQDVIALVQNGKAHFGFLFAPDAMTAKDIVIHALSASTAPAPTHFFSVKQGQQGHAVAQRFLSFINDSEARESVMRRGYELTADTQPIQTPFLR